MPDNSAANEARAAQLAGELATLWPSLAAEARQSILARFADTGIAIDGKMPLAKSVREVCALPDNTSASPMAMQIALELILGFARTVERVAWATWKTVAPQSFLRSNTEIGRLFGRLLVGSPDAEKLTAVELQRLSELIGAIITAIPRATQVSAQHWKHLMPKEIRIAVDTQTPGKGHVDGLCWEKYTELAVDFDEQALENEVRRAVALHVDRLVNRVEIDT